MVKSPMAPKQAKKKANMARKPRAKGGWTLLRRATRPAAVSSAVTLRRPAANAPVRLSPDTDFLQKITVKAGANITTAADRILAVVPVSPSSYPGTRITNFAPNWERYRFHKFDVRYVPAVPTTLACQLVMYIDTDPSDDPSVVVDPDQLVRNAVSHAGAVQWNFHEFHSAPLVQRADPIMYYTGLEGTDKRLVFQGKAYIIQVTDPVNFNGDPLTSNIVAGTLYADWDVSFQTPQINSVPATVASEMVVDRFQILQPEEQNDYSNYAQGSLTISQPSVVRWGTSVLLAPFAEPIADGAEFSLKFSHATDPALNRTLAVGYAAVPTQQDAVRLDSGEQDFLLPGSYVVTTTRNLGGDTSVFIEAPGSASGPPNFQVFGLSTLPRPVWNPVTPP